MHDQPARADSGPTAGEWVIGIAFVLATVVVVLAIALSIAGVLP